MKDIDYAYAVGRIRANELSLLTTSEIEQMITSPNKENVLRILADKGWDTDCADIAQTQLSDTWRLISECAPSSQLLEAMVIGNDFSNLKACIKAVFSHNDPEDYYISPCICDTELITRAVKDGDFSELPRYLSAAGEKAYDCAARLSSGMLAEVYIDKASLETRLEFAKKSGSSLLERIINLQCAAADIKIALRCSATGKTADFAAQAMCECPGIDIGELTAVSDSTQHIASYLETTPFSCLSDSIRSGFTSFEKECDTLQYKYLEDTKWDVFGPNPLVSYFYSKVNETKNVRIILSGKEVGLSADEIRMRVRGYSV